MCVVSSHNHMSESAYAYEEASFVCLPVGITDNYGTVGIAKKNQPMSFMVALINSNASN